MNKRGMSAMLSTIILVLFAAMLGFVVMSWGTGMAGEIPDQCGKISLSISAEDGAVVVIPKVNNILCRDKRLDVTEALK